MSTDPGVWYVGINGQQQGPLGVQQILDMIRAGTITQTAYVYGQSNPTWVPIHSVPAFQQAFHASPPPPPPPPPAGPAPMVADQIDFEMFGEEMQFVEIVLDPGEAAIAEAGAFFYMDPGIRMETVMGDGSKPQQGFMDKLLQAGKRLLTGESLFMTIFHNDHKTARQKVSFAAPYPGKIIPIDLRQYNGTLICQKDAFLCAAKGIAVGIHLNKKIGAGLFGGEGFILQKLEGQGLAFIHAGGTIVAKELAPGEMLRLDTGCLVAFEPKVNYDIQWVGGFKTALFGGEGLFFATLTGPGKVWLQSLPFSRLAGRILAAAVASGFGRGPDEGSAIGGLGLGS